MGFLSGIDPTNCLIGEPLADHTPERHSGAAFVIHAKGNPVVIAEVVFAEIAVQVLFLTVLCPALTEHLGAVMTMRQLSSNWHDFMATLDKLRPRLDVKTLGKAQQLSSDYDGTTDNGQGI